MKGTIESLAKAFIGESQARNRYTFYSKVAKKEGYEQISEVFRITADNEKEHAEWLFKLMNRLKKGDPEFDDIKVPSDVPTICGNTIANLKSAITGENYEHTRMYPEFAEIARAEGYSEIADRLLSIAKAEEHHEERYMKFLKQLEAGTLLKKEKEVWWFCRECGYKHFGKEPPEKCPSCDHPRAYYQVMCEEY
jgi:rubrerythrin